MTPWGPFAPTISWTTVLQLLLGWQLCLFSMEWRGIAIVIAKMGTEPYSYSSLRKNRNHPRSRNCNSWTNCRGLLDLLNFLAIHVRLEWCSHSITMEALTPTRYKTAKIDRIKHISGVNASLEVYTNRTFCPFVGSGDRARACSRSRRTGTRRPGRSTRRWTDDRRRTAPGWTCGSTYRRAAGTACDPCSASSTNEFHEFQRIENAKRGIRFYLRYNFWNLSISFKALSWNGCPTLKSALRTFKQ